MSAYDLPDIRSANLFLWLLADMNVSSSGNWELPLRRWDRFNVCGSIWVSKNLISLEGLSFLKRRVGATFEVIKGWEWQINRCLKFVTKSSFVLQSALSISSVYMVVSWLFNFV